MPKSSAETLPRSRAARLRAMLHSPELEFIMEAHNGLSAKIVEETGFQGIWASGLSMSAALGVRDNNEASWTQILEVLEFMADAASIPILMDGDTGFGNFNNMRRLVTKLEQRRIAGVAIEDKLFPKTNSFIGDGQPLADIDEFCGKIKAGKDSQRDDAFSIVARVEALIAGWGLGEALRRAEAYRSAGADAILIHSKRPEADEILAFTKEWAGRCPLVIVPTKYYRTPTEAYREAGISLVIWANHNLRTAITAMRATSREIFESESLVGLEDRVASVSDVFALQNNEELQEAEARYLPTSARASTGVILAASRGGALGHFTDSAPKCMLDIRGKPLLRRLVDTLRQGGVRSVHVVRGYMKDAIDLADIKTADNDRYADTGEAYSLACAETALEGEVILAYGDILFAPGVLGQLDRAVHDATLVVDARYRDNPTHGPGRVVDLVRASRPYCGDFLDDEEAVALEALGSALPEDEAHGEWIGLVKFSEAGTAALRRALADRRKAGSLAEARLPDLIEDLRRDGLDVGVVYISGGWIDIDDAADLAAARNML